MDNMLPVTLFRDISLTSRLYTRRLHFKESAMPDLHKLNLYAADRSQLQLTEQVLSLLQSISDFMLHAATCGSTLYSYLYPVFSNKLWI